MRIRYLLVILFVFLDVAMPFSCVNRSRENYNNKPKVLYRYVQVMEVDGREQRRTIHSEEIILNGTQAGVFTINEPEVPKGIKEDYKVIKYQLFDHYTADGDVYHDINFPFTTKEEDFKSYFEGHRTVVVIYAIVEPIE